MRHGVRIVVAGLLALGLAVFAISCGTRQTATDTSTTGSPAAPAAMAVNQVGEQAFLAYCAMCHGERGAGDGPLAAELAKQNLTLPAHLNDRPRLDALGRGGVITVVEKGGAHTGRSAVMPAWSEQLSPALVDSITDYVMALPDLASGTPSATIAAYLAPPPGVSAETRRLFVYYCSGCHGPQGKGDGFNVEALRARHAISPRDLTDGQYFGRRSDQEIQAAIALGGGHVGKSVQMPAWTYTLTAGQIGDLVAYLRVLSGTPTPR